MVAVPAGAEIFMRSLASLAARSPSPAFVVGKPVTPDADVPVDDVLRSRDAVSEFKLPRIFSLI